MQGLIFDIKEFALNDGGGILSTVFFKGCPLRCAWCHNPEGLSPKRELYVKQKGCLHCGLCRKPCNHPDCQGLGRCLHICPKNLVSVAGVEWESGALAEKLLRQTDIYRETGGGVTLSGGEPLLQWQFAAKLLDRLHGKVHTETFGRVQEELARQSSKMEGKKVGDKTLQRKYSGKYAMSDLLICGECGSAYRRRTWTAKGEKRIVWRCMNRLEHGKQNCRHSPTLDEDSLQAAVMDAITERVKNDPELLQTLQTEIEKGLSVSTPTQSDIQDITNRMAEIDRKFADLLRTVSIGNDSAHDAELEALMTEKNDLRQRLQAMEQGSAQHEKRKEDLTAILPVLRNRPLPYDDALVRQTVKGIIADSKAQIRVVFPDGETVEQLI